MTLQGERASAEADTPTRGYPMRTSTAVILFASLAPIPALANDTSAELATGGLVFVRTDNVEMRAEELIRLRLVEIEEFDIGKGMEKHLRARWTLKTTYHWEQTFPAGREIVIEHRYKPSVGGSVETSLASPGSGKESWFADYRRKYCLDQELLSSLERARRAGKREFGAPFSEER